MLNQRTKTNQTACPFTATSNAIIDIDYMIRYCREQFGEQGNASVESINHLRPPLVHRYWHFNLLLWMVMTKILSVYIHCHPSYITLDWNFPKRRVHVNCAFFIENKNSTNHIRCVWYAMSICSSVELLINAWCTITLLVLLYSVNNNGLAMHFTT